jgi:hypothetical protein
MGIPFGGINTYDQACQCTYVGSYFRPSAVVVGTPLRNIGYARYLASRMVASMD